LQSWKIRDGKKRDPLRLSRCRQFDRTAQKGNPSTKNAEDRYIAPHTDTQSKGYIGDQPRETWICPHEVRKMQRRLQAGPHRSKGSLRRVGAGAGGMHKFIYGGSMKNQAMIHLFPVFP
jgi:hypothetical protein